MQPILVEVFGANALQTADELIVKKSDLVGLTPLASNTAESLFVATLLKAAAKLNDINRDADSDIQVAISENNVSLLTQNSIRYKVTSYTVELYKVEPITAVNPMDY